jgi:hypothetical protein
MNLIERERIERARSELVKLRSENLLRGRVDAALGDRAEVIDRLRAKHEAEKEMLFKMKAEEEKAELDAIEKELKKHGIMEFNEKLLQLLTEYKQLLEGRAGDYASDGESIDSMIEKIKNDECTLFAIESPTNLSTFVISEFVKKATVAKTTLKEDQFAVRKCAIHMRQCEVEYCDCDEKCENCSLALLEEMEMNS